MNEIDIVIPGAPTGKARARFGNGRTYTPRDTILAEQAIRCAWQDAGCQRLADGPVQLRVTIGVERPRGHFKRDGSLSAEGARTMRPFRQKPDADNAVKLIMDALNGRAYRDDVQVVDLHVTRIWTENAFTRVQAHNVGIVHVLGQAAA